MKQKNKERRCLSMLLGTLGASLLGHALSRKGVMRAEQHLRIPPHPLTNFEIQKYYQNEPNFNGVYSRNNLSKIKDATYIINLDEYELIGTHQIALYANADNVTYFDSFGAEYFPKEIGKNIL